MRRIIATFVAGLLAFGLGACSKNEGTRPDADILADSIDAYRQMFPDQKNSSDAMVEATFASTCEYLSEAKGEGVSATKAWEQMHSEIGTRRNFTDSQTGFVISLSVASKCRDLSGWMSSSGKLMYPDELK